MKPILFNTEMVKAILDGRKSTFRIPIKKEKICEDWIMERQAFKDTISKYKIDDVLYVKETFCIGAYDDDGGCETNGYSSETYISQCSSDIDIIYYADAIDVC